MSAEGNFQQACFWGLKTKHFWLRGCGPSLYIYIYLYIYIIRTHVCALKPHLFQWILKCSEWICERISIKRIWLPQSLLKRLTIISLSYDPKPLHMSKTNPSDFPTLRQLSPCDPFFFVWPSQGGFGWKKAIN